MSTLADSLNFVITALQSSSLCSAVNILETDQFTESQYALKVRASLTTGMVLQVRLYYNASHIDYAYQLLLGDKPIIRWDNKEHFPTISTYPHHFHSASGVPQDSPLTGDLTHDLPVVLNYAAALKP